MYVCYNIMHDPKDKKIFGVKTKNIRGFGKELNTAGKIMDVGGSTMMMAGAASGTPQLVALGAGSRLSGQAFKSTGKVLKKAQKAKK